MFEGLKNWLSQLLVVCMMVAGVAAGSQAPTTAQVATLDPSWDPPYGVVADNDNEHKKPFPHLTKSPIFLPPPFQVPPVEPAPAPTPPICTTWCQPDPTPKPKPNPDPPQPPQDPTDPPIVIPPPPFPKCYYADSFADSTSTYYPICECYYVMGVDNTVPTCPNLDY